MASYRLQIKRSAAKELEALPRKDRRRIVQRIRALAGTPGPRGGERLSGQERYRIRQGSYRILYSISDENALVIIVKIAHRRAVYRH